VVVDKMIEHVTKWADEDYAVLHVIYLSEVKNEIIKL
jgi:hypothetical protein